MARYTGTVTDQNDVPLPGARVLVQVSSTGAYASLTDDSGGFIPNPIVTDALGSFVFNVADGLYDLTYQAAKGGRIVRQLFGVQIGTPQIDPNVNAAIASAVAASQASIEGEIAALTTSSIGEGSRLYFTAARAQAAITGSTTVTVSGGVVSQTKAQAIQALGFTPYDSANPAGYVTVATARTSLSGSSTVTYNNATGSFSLTSANITSALGTAPLLLSGGILTGPLIAAANPTDPLGVATKQYVDQLASGRQPKASVVAASTANISSLYGTMTVDGVALVVGNRFLAKDQTDQTTNGIYIVQSAAWTRATDMDTWAETVNAAVTVTGGTVNANTTWISNSASTGTIGTTPITFVLDSAQPNYAATGGITKTSLTFSLTPIANNTFLANTSGSSAAPVATTIVAFLGGSPALLNTNNTFTGIVGSRASGSTGGASLVTGDAASSGYHTVYGPDGTRIAALGYTITGQPTQFIQDKGNGWAFTGGPISSDSDPSSASHLIRRSWLQASTGALNTGYNSGDASAVTRTLKAKLREQWVSVTDFGAVADSNVTTGNGTDNLAAFNAAVASGARTIFIPAAAAGMGYRLSAMWDPGRSVRIVGEGCVPYTGGTPGVGRGQGSWLYIDHTGTGLRLYNSAVGDLTGGEVHGVGFIRNQPAFAPGWAPNNNDFDMLCLQGEWWIDNICFYNSTLALGHNYAGFGRMRVGHIYGDPYQVGLEIDRAYDLVRVGSVHWWPYSTFSTYAQAYKYANFKPLNVGHVDGLIINDFFAINGHHIDFHQGADGQPPRDVFIGNLYCDLFGYAGIVVNSNASGGSFSVGSLEVQGAVSADGNPSGAQAGVIIQAPSFIGKIGHARFTRFNQQCAIVTGNNSHLYIGPDTIDDWNRSAISASAYAVTGTGSRILKTALSTVLTSGGSIGDGSGKVYQPVFNTI